MPMLIVITFVRVAIGPPDRSVLQVTARWMRRLVSMNSKMRSTPRMDDTRAP